MRKAAARMKKRSDGAPDGARRGARAGHLSARSTPSAPHAERSEASRSLAAGGQIPRFAWNDDAGAHRRAQSDAGDQTLLFARSEGDRWFERNRAAIRRWSPDRDTPLRMMELYGLKPETVLEIGAADGFRLGAIRQRWHARCVAVDASGAAVAAGRERFPQVEFVHASADAIPLYERFDLVIVNFVLHWVDRRKLTATAAEIDRLLADDGCLILGDFLPSAPTRVPYHHLPDREVYTYKQDYAAMFEATGLYRRVALLTGGHAAGRLAVDVDDPERVATHLLKRR